MGYGPSGSPVGQEWVFSPHQANRGDPFRAILYWFVSLDRIPRGARSRASEACGSASRKWAFSIAEVGELSDKAKY